MLDVTFAPATTLGHKTQPVCPRCGGALAETGTCKTCDRCGTIYASRNGIDSLLVEQVDLEFTRGIRAFYESHPFPAYDGVLDSAALLARATPDSFAQTLDRSLPLGATVLELGCGTGQLTNFLGLTGRFATGADLSMASLLRGESFRQHERIDRARFVQMDIFAPAFRPESFDVVISMGVLHHTRDPKGAIAIAASLLKPGGHLIVGLYHRYARFRHNMRRRLLRHDVATLERQDTVLRRSRSDDRREAWFFDQYEHPYETCHTAAEARDWFEAAEIEFVRTVPDYGSAKTQYAPSDLLQPPAQTSPLKARIAEVAQAFTRNEDGGLFVAVGRKPTGACS
jgi:SAM-dependent methyltransferase